MPWISARRLREIEHHLERLDKQVCEVQYENRVFAPAYINFSFKRDSVPLKEVVTALMDTLGYEYLVSPEETTVRISKVKKK